MKLRAILTILAVAGMAILLFVPAKLHAAEPVDLTDIGTTCLQSPLDECKVFTAGYLNRVEYNDDDGAPMIAWQTQWGSTEMDGIIGGFVLFQHGADGWSLLDSGFDGFFQLPQLNDEGLLHISGYSQGTGSFNTDRLYQRDDSTGWTSIEMSQWFDQIGPMLPEGLEIWKGVEYDFSSPWSGLVARTSLWRSDDGNCCPSGGSAVITLEIQDQWLVATSVDYEPPSKTK
jgi:hypothetical protein